MTRVEAQRRRECKEMDCVWYDDCLVKWGKECIKQFGNKIPRLPEGAISRAKRGLRLPRVERISNNIIFWLSRQTDEYVEEGIEAPYGIQENISQG